MNLVLKKFRILGKKGEGTFSEVLKCQNINDGTYWACKKMKQSYDSLEQVNNLREIQAMRRLSPHPHILELHEVIFDKKSGTLALICELMDMNIYELIKGKRSYLPEQTVKSYMFQLLKALEHMQKNGIFHRDVKPENILIKEDLLKLADFGSCRSVFSKQPYTEYISTRWYRAPECLLTDGYYTYKMDMWSVGCVFFEVLSLHPLFPGSNEVDQIAKIHDIIGTPEPNVLNKFKKSRGMNFNFPTKKGSGIERLLPMASPESIDLIYKMCTYDPDERVTAKQAIKHNYFKEFRDADKRAAVLARKQMDEANENATEVIRRHRHPSERSFQESVPETHQSDKAVERNPIVPDLTVYPSVPKAQSLPSHIDTKKDANYRRRRRNKRTTGTFQYSNHTGLLPRVSMQDSSTKFQGSSFQNTLLPTTKYNSSSYLPNISNSYRTQKPSGSHKPAYYGHYLQSLERRGAGF